MHSFRSPYNLREHNARPRTEKKKLEIHDTLAVIRRAALALRGHETNVYQTNNNTDLYSYVYGTRVVFKF